MNVCYSTRWPLGVVAACLVAGTAARTEEPPDAEE